MMDVYCKSQRPLFRGMLCRLGEPQSYLLTSLSSTPYQLFRGSSRPMDGDLFVLRRGTRDKISSPAHQGVQGNHNSEHDEVLNGM